MKTKFLFLTAAAGIVLSSANAFAAEAMPSIAGYLTDASQIETQLTAASEKKVTIGLGDQSFDLDPKSSQLAIDLKSQTVKVAGILSTDDAEADSDIPSKMAFKLQISNCNTQVIKTTETRGTAQSEKGFPATAIYLSCKDMNFAIKSLSEDSDMNQTKEMSLDQPVLLRIVAVKYSATQPKNFSDRAGKTRAFVEAVTPETLRTLPQGEFAELKSLGLIEDEYSVYDGLMIDASLQ